MNPPKSAQLLFDGEGEYFASNIVREDWPMTHVFQESDETIEFQETIIDVQGRTNGRSDYLYRRFDSVRSGVRRR